jgi:hypothetical protein
MPTLKINSRWLHLPVLKRLRCYVPTMNRGLIGTIVGVLVVIILVLVILRMT